MKSNPYLSAIIAFLYVVLIVFVINTIASNEASEETLLLPITMLSLLTLSVATMAYLFFGEPLKLCFSRDYKTATKFFYRMIGTFTLFTAFSAGVLMVLR